MKVEFALRVRLKRAEYTLFPRYPTSIRPSFKKLNTFKKVLKLVMFSDGTFHTTYESELLGIVPRN